MEKIKEILYKVNSEIDLTSKDFIADGYLDSFSLMELIGILEETYNVNIFGEEIEIENFTNLQKIKEYLKQKGIS